MQSITLVTPEDLIALLEELRAIRQEQAKASQLVDDYLSVDDVAALTRTSARTVRKWITEGKYDQAGKLIKLFTVEFSPGYPRVPRSALLAYGQALGFDASQLQLPTAGALAKTRPVLDSAKALRRAS